MAAETGSDDGQPDPAVDFSKLRPTGPSIGNNKLGPRSIMEWFNELADSIVCRSASATGPVFSHDSVSQNLTSEDEDEDKCEKSPTGAHEPDPNTFEAATGYDIATEGGIVYQVRCVHCNAQGSGLVKLEDIGW